jgi:hypothetical protein
MRVSGHARGTTARDDTVLGRDGRDGAGRGRSARKPKPLAVRGLAVTGLAVTGLAVTGLAGAVALSGAPAAASAGPGPAAAAGAGRGAPAVPPRDVPVVLEPCLHGGRLMTCWAVRPTNDGDAALSFNIVIGRGRGEVTAFVSGLTRWGRWSAGAARTRCAPACPRLTASFPPGLWTVVAGLRLTLSRPLGARYPAGSFRYYSRLRIDDARQGRHETLAWSWRLDRYARTGGEIPGLRL